MDPPRVPFVPTPTVVVHEMLSLADVGPDDVLYDLGCGDGRIPVLAVMERWVRRAYCVEDNPVLARIARSIAEKAGVKDRIKVIEKDMFNVELVDATAVTLFLITSANEALRPKLEKELKRGTRVVSNVFEVPGWTPRKVLPYYVEGRVSRIYLYLIGRHRGNL